MNDLSTLAALQARDARHHFHPNTDMAALNAEGTRVIVSGRGRVAERCIRPAYSRWVFRTLERRGRLWTARNRGRGLRADGAVAVLQYVFSNRRRCRRSNWRKCWARWRRALPNASLPIRGSEGNDTIIRMVRHYWKLRGQPAKSTFIARHNGYHGSTVGGASLGGMEYMHKQGDLPIPGVIHVQQPYWWGEGGDLSPAEFGLHAAREIGRAIDRVGAENVAAFIGEPIQGAGGVIMPPDTYWPEVERICRERDVLIVSDEVICGFGRTGAWFGSQYYGFTSDLMTFAKNVTSGYLPLGGVMVSDAMSDVLAKGGAFWHGFTTSGHPVCCAAGVANLKIIIEEKLVDRVRDDIGPYLKQRWSSLADHKLVGEARMVGLLGGLELTPDRATRAKFVKFDEVGSICRDYAYQRGLILRATGSTMLTAPPYVLSESEADQLVDIAREALDDTAAELARRGWL